MLLTICQISDPYQSEMYLLSSIRREKVAGWTSEQKMLILTHCMLPTTCQIGDLLKSKIYTNGVHRNFSWLRILPVPTRCLAYGQIHLFAFASLPPASCPGSTGRLIPREGSPGVTSASGVSHLRHRQWIFPDFSKHLVWRCRRADPQGIPSRSIGSIPEDPRWRTSSGVKPAIATAPTQLSVLRDF